MNTSPLHASALPDPVEQAEFYKDIPIKRLGAFVIDSVIVLALSVVLLPFTAFTALFFFWFWANAIGFVLRAISIAAGSATPGMRLMAIELRNHRGERLSGGLAMMHTALSILTLSIALPQILSVLTILFTERRQSLADMVLGTAALNRRARS